MSTFDRNSNMRYAAAGANAQAGVYDEGLRAYMLGVYNYMALGLGITGVLALATAYFATTQDPAQAAATLGNGTLLTQLGVTLYGSPLKWVVMLAPLAMVFFLSFRIQSMSASTAQTTFWVYAALMGLSLSSIFLVYTGGSIAATFFATAGAFAGLSLFGYTTKKDLSGIGSFLIMGVIGLIIASVINIFVQSTALMWAVSFLGVLIFAGLTAYDTQRLKMQYYQLAGTEFMGKAVVLGALSLYLDFINMFQFLLAFMGQRD